MPSGFSADARERFDGASVRRRPSIAGSPRLACPACRASPATIMRIIVTAIWAAA
jgi:hypothetical protein